MDLINISLVIVAFTNFTLAVFIYLENRRHPINLSYTLVIISVVGWIWGMIMYRLIPQGSLVLWTKILYSMATLTASTFLYFSIIFPYKDRFPSWKKGVVIFFSNLVVIGITLATNLVIKGAVRQAAQENQIIFGELYPLYVLYILGFFGLGFITLFKKFFTSSGITRTQLKFVFAGYFIAATLAFFTNLILPWFGVFQLNWLGQILSLIMVSFTTYAITKHHLMEIRVVATEILTALLLLLFLVNIFFYQNLKELFFNIGIFLGAVVVGILLIRSVLREIKYRERVEEAYQKLKKLDEAKTEFISIASHQLRTPLTAIKGYISMILEGNYGEVSEEVKKPMKNVFESNERLIELVNDLLNVSRIESGKLDLELEKASVEKLISEVVEELKLKAEKKGVDLQWEATGTLPEIKFDYDKMRQVVLNLIDNSIRYTEEGRIKVEVEQKEDKIKITISDTGQGMEEEEIESLFNRFSRGEAGNKLHTEGAGLGLYISKKFTEMHGGEIWATSEGPGEGSTFHITLPINHE